jgi:dTDP-4-amino-4,6-dideoxygalactose transaminase
MMNIFSGELMSKVEFFTFKDAPESLKSEWGIAIGEAIDSGVFIGGPLVAKFEAEWANYLGVSHAIGVGNGYDAIVVALKVLGVGPGDLVAVPNHTFIATWLAVDAVGATPVGIDCNQFGLMNIEELESLSLDFSAVIPVHMHGQMVDMPRLMIWAEKNNVKIVEDCAQAHGARINGKLAGTWGDFGAFSFYPTKNLGAIGDAGSLVTKDESLASKARSFVNYGSVPGNKYEYQFHGINSRLDPLQAVVLRINLRYLDSWNTRRKQIAQMYIDGFKDSGINFLPIERDSVFHHFILFSENRDVTRMLLETAGIKTEIHYPESAKRSFSKFQENDLPEPQTNASKFARTTLSIPISPWMTDSSVHTVINAVLTTKVRNSFFVENS